MSTFIPITFYVLYGVSFDSNNLLMSFKSALITINVYILYTDFDPNNLSFLLFPSSSMNVRGHWSEEGTA